MAATTATAHIPWSNWSGCRQHRIQQLATPHSLQQLLALLAQAQAGNLKVRCVGSSHSFSPFWTDDIILSLDGFQGLLEVDATTRRAKVGAGAKLHQLGPLLWREGLSLPQQGDIDRQSVAGAVSTGTHGTGPGLRNLCAPIIELTLVTAAGEVLTVSPEQQQLFAASQLCCGLLGVLVDVTLELESAFYLHQHTWDADVDSCAEALPELVRDNRHFEFFWIPRSDRMEMKTLNKTDDTVSEVGVDEATGPAFEIFPSERNMKFNEMEYAVAAEDGWDCFCELRRMLLRDFPKLPWPLEYRTLAADELPLSPAFQRDSVTISVHQAAQRDPAPLFQAAESIFRNYRGRPHWGKCHSLTGGELKRLYPGYTDFLVLREQLDPQQRFLTPALEKLFSGVV